MTSKDEEIQELYNIINSFSIHKLDQSECKCKIEDGSCDNCMEKIADAREKYGLVTRSEFDFLLKERIGIKIDLNTQPFRHRDIIRHVSKLDSIYGKYDYQILFIEHGIRLTMTKDFVKKISILKSILLEENGYDKAFQSRYLSSDLNPSNGPKIYITKLPIDSLIFDKPPSDLNVRFTNIAERPTIQETGWFAYNNIAEALWNYLYY